jgi:hypothetical protein
MSRMSGPEQIVVRPTSNIYTALSAAAVVLLLVGLIVLYVMHDTIFGKNLFS